LANGPFQGFEVASSFNTSFQVILSHINGLAHPASFSRIPPIMHAMLLEGEEESHSCSMKLEYSRHAVFPPIRADVMLILEQTQNIRRLLI